MTRLRGRSAKGTRLNSKAHFGHWGTQTFVAGLKCDGLIAPWVIDAPMNRVIFETYVETQLAPALKPGDVVILDNLSSHKSERADKAIRAQGARHGGAGPSKSDEAPQLQWCLRSLTQS